MKPKCHSCHNRHQNGRLPMPYESSSPTDFMDYHRFLLIFLVVSRKKRNFASKLNI